MKKGLARNGLVQNPNKYTVTASYFPLTCPALPCIDLLPVHRQTRRDVHGGIDASRRRWFCTLPLVPLFPESQSPKIVKRCCGPCC